MAGGHTEVLVGEQMTTGVPFSVLAREQEQQDVGPLVRVDGREELFAFRQPREPVHLFCELPPALGAAVKLQKERAATLRAQEDSLTVRSDGEPVRPLFRAATLGPPSRQTMSWGLPAAEDQGDEEVVDLEEMGELGVVHELLIASDPLLDALEVEVVVAGDDVGAELTQDVVERRGALRAPRLEPSHYAAFVQLEHAFSGFARLGEVKVAELVDRENTVLVEVEANLKVPFGDPVSGSKDIFGRDTGEERPLAGATSLTAHRTPGHTR